MGRQTGTYPAADQTFLTRIMHALDVDERGLAKAIGVRASRIRELDNEELDRSDLWWKINEYVDEQLGLLMAARTELGKRLTAERSKRAARHAQLLARPGRSSPR